MSFKRKMLTLAMASFVSLALVACGGEESKVKDFGDQGEATGIYPKDIEKLLNDEYALSIKAVGMGNHPNQIQALKKARLQADVELARTFEQEIAAIQKSFMETVNDEMLEEYRETVEGFTLIKLSGAQVVKEMTTRGNDGFQAYVLKVISPEVIKDQIDKMKNATTELNALAAYEELEFRVAQEKAARNAAK